MAECAGVSEQSGRDADGCRMPIQATPDEPDNANTVTDGMLGLSIDPRSQNELDENTNADAVYPLYSRAAKDVIDMGYSRKAVAMAIEECKSKNLGITSWKILNVLLDKQERGEALPEDKPEPETPGFPEFDGDSQQSLLKEREYLQNRIRCRKCRVNDCNVVFLPCQHHKMCESCAKDTTRCFMCSETILHKVKTYMS